MGRWAVEQGRRKLYLRVVGMLLGGRGGGDLPILWQRASGEGPTTPELGQRERWVPQIGMCCLNAVEQRDDAHPPFSPADGMWPDH